MYKQFIMKSIALILLSLLMNVSIASAQSNPIDEAKQRATKLTELMNEKLKLSSDQLAKITELNLGVAIKNTTVINSADQSYDFKVASIKGNNQGRKDYLKVFLTAEQYQKFESLENEFVTSDLIESIEDIK